MFRSWPALLLAERGDCEDLAAARCSELLAAGRRAMVQLVPIAEHSDGGRDYHVRVNCEGVIEDPSELLGDNGFASCDPQGPHGAPCEMR